MKWLQFQLVRNSLQTNYVVSHFIANVSPTCSYCENPESSELISHLFWFCPYVNAFLRETFDFICSTGLNYAPTRDQFLFGFQNIDFSSPKNYITLVLKKYIWSTKFKTKNLSLVGFKNLLKTYVRDIECIFEMQNKPEKFSDWNAVKNSL